MATKKNGFVVCYEECKIELTQAFEKKARIWGSPEFDELKEAREAFPTYKIVVKPSQKKRKSSVHYNGLTYTYMETYIKAHNAELMNTFKVKQGKYVEGMDAQPEKDSYGMILKWFLEQFPEIEEFYQNRTNTKKAA